MKRSDSETDIKKRNDRVGKYLKSCLNDFVFDEFSDEFMNKMEVKELMKGVPIPFKKEDLEQFKSNQGLKIEKITRNMTWVIGINPKFKYAEHYIAFLIKLYGCDFFEALSEEGKTALEKEDFTTACILFRACICMRTDYLYGMFGYAQTCREMYLQGGDEDYVGNFKAESIDFFELITEDYPDFAPAYYFLGYAYLNLGLYIKADITWKQFMDKSDEVKEKSEIQERLNQLEIPVKIEGGCLDISTGKYAEGIFKLEPYAEGRFETWWPLFYYLGIAHSRLNQTKEALDNFKKVLKINPSNIEVMTELAEIYSREGDAENQKKYLNKIELIKSQLTQN